MMGLDMKSFINKTLKKKFKCNVCKSKYPVTVDMTRGIWWKTGFGDKRIAKGFNCPACGNLYVNFGHDNSWVHECWEFHDIEENI